MKLGITAGCISGIAFFPYLISILRGRTKPNKVTWWIWSLLGTLLFFSYKDSGATNTLWVPFSYMITPLLVALLSVKFGVGGWSRFDMVCLSGSFISTLIWFVLGSPTVALLLYIAIDLFGLLPTIKKTRLHPEQEDSLAWLLMVVANCMNIFAAEELKFSIIVYPLYMFIAGSVVFGLSLRRKR